MSEFDEWEERETCWISKVEQGTERWKNLRYGSISSSNINECTGRSAYKIPGDMRTEEQKKIDLAMILCGLKEKEFSEEAKAHMARGTTLEPYIREFHFKTLRDKGLNCEMRELGIAVWKKHSFFRGSVDGEIGIDGISEYKACKTMYKPLVEYTDAINRGYKPREDEKTKHIYLSHLDQMTLNSIILNKKWCEYCVVCIDTKECFIQRIDTDHELWNNILYPKALNFYNNYMLPLINQHNITPILPPSYNL